MSDIIHQISLTQKEIAIIYFTLSEKINSLNNQNNQRDNLSICELETIIKKLFI